MDIKRCWIYSLAITFLKTIMFEGHIFTPLRSSPFKAKGVFSFSSSSNSNIGWCHVLCVCLSNFGFILGDLLNNFKRHLVYYNLSFSFKTFALDVKACYVLVGLALLISVDYSLAKNITSTLLWPMQNGIHPFQHQFSL